MTAREPVTSDSCLNCGHVVAERFCPRCGQEATSLHRPFRELLSGALGDLFTLDSRIGRSIVPLFVRPGFLTAEYVRGRRVRYVPPFRIWILASILFFAVSGLTGAGFLNIETSGEPPSEVVPAPRNDFEREVAERVELAASQAEQFRQRVIEGFSYAQFALTPLFALLVMGLYRRERRYYIEHLVFAFHFGTFIFLVGTLMAIAGALMDDRWPTLATGIVLVTIAWIAVYLLVALKRVYGGSVVATILKGGTLLGVYLLLLILASFAVLSIALFLL